MTLVCLRNNVVRDEFAAFEEVRDVLINLIATLPAHRALVVGDLDPQHAAFAEPLACTLHGVDIGAPVPGDSEPTVPLKT